MSKEISRREFFKIAGGIAAGASFSSLTTSCASTPTLEKPTSQLTRNVIPETTSSEPTFSPTETPTVTPIPKPTNTLIPKPTFTPEQTPTAEVVVFPQTQITAELLKQGFANVGGAEETIDLSKITTQNAKEAQTLSWKTIEGYASLAWDEKISLEDLAKDEIKAAKAVVSLGSQAGVEGFYRPGEVLPQFKDLTLLRLAIDKLPGSQDFYDAKLSSFPQNLIIRKGSHLTVLGLWADESGRWATVATDEGFDREKSGIQPRDIPRQYLAVIPQDLPDNIEGLSLQRLLNANNYNYSNGVVENLGDTGKLYHQELNIIEPTLAKNLEKEAGALFMDQKPDGSWYENPIVPYPAKEITGDTYGGVTVTKDGQVVAMSSDGTKEIAKAKYDSEKRQWVWEAVVVATPTPEATAGDAGTVLVGKEGLLPDFRETKEISSVEMEINGEKREFLGWRLGFTEVFVDKEFVALDIDFGMGGHKNAGETILPNLAEPAAAENVEKIGALVHAINLGIVSRSAKEVPIDWYDKYIKYLQDNSGTSYELKGFVPVVGKTGTYEEGNLGNVDPGLPVKFILLPPRLDFNEAWERVDRIGGGDPRAPFHLVYAEQSGGYFQIDVINRQLYVWNSGFTLKGKLYSDRIFSAAAHLYDLIEISSRLSAIRSPITSFQSGPDSEIYIPATNPLFFADAGQWKRPYLIWDKSFK